MKMERTMTTNTALKDEMELATARKALKEMTPEQLLKLNAAAQELAAARKEIEEHRKRSLGDHSTANAPVVDRRQIFEQLKEALEMFFPGVEFTYERSYLAQRLANDVTFLGRNKLRRKRGVLARVNRAHDQDLDGIRQEYGRHSTGVRHRDPAHRDAAERGKPVDHQRESGAMQGAATGVDHLLRDAERSQVAGAARDEQRQQSPGPQRDVTRCAELPPA
jgi:hypothetical protein